MLPSFFKKLGPIDINKIKSTIKCETVNVLDSDVFYDFVNNMIRLKIQYLLI